MADAPIHPKGPKAPSDCLHSTLPLRHLDFLLSAGLGYHLARNQYINNSPGIFSCIRAGTNTGATCICTEMNSLKNLANMREMVPRKYFPVFAQVRIQAPHVFAQNLIPQEVFPACIGFVPGGKCRCCPVKVQFGGLQCLEEELKGGRKVQIF